METSTISEAARHSSAASAPRVCFVTMGCAKNEVDTRSMTKRCIDAGFEVADDAEDADFIVVNTCSFIQSATEESIEAILDVAGLTNVADGDAALIVAGCMPARYGEELEESLEEAGAFVPCSKEDDIVDVIEGLPVFKRRFGGFAPDGDGFAGSDAATCRALAQTYAYVKISDGCDRWCSYCTIPVIRGRYRSFSYGDVFDEVASLAAEGVREIDLIAQDTGRWGEDFEDPETLASLMERLAVAFPDTWFRVMYLQPEGVTDELLDVMASHDNICSYLDIPLQHVDRDILRAMNRRGDGESFKELIGRIEARIPDVTLRTTLIAGFPGETEEAFESLCSFVSEGYFDYVGVFSYSREEGTKAYDLPHQIDEEEKISRAQRLRDIADAVSCTLIAERVGDTYGILVEGREEDGQLFGRARCQAPEVDGVTYIGSGEVGEFVTAKIVDTLFYEMEGE